jgi:hypothetical protein
MSHHACIFLRFLRAFLLPPLPACRHRQAVKSLGTHHQLSTNKIRRTKSFSSHFESKSLRIKKEKCSNSKRITSFIKVPSSLTASPFSFHALTDAIASFTSANLPGGIRGRLCAGNRCLSVGVNVANLEMDFSKASRSVPGPDSYREKSHSGPS